MFENIVDGLWQHIVNVVTLQFIDQWWFYLFDLIIIGLVLAALGWYFEKLRPLAGYITFGLAFALYAYDKGEKDTAKKYDKELEDARQKQKQNQQGGGWWN